MPYLGLHLTDLTDIDRGGSHWVAPGRVNFFKFSLLAAVLRDLFQHQQSRYSFNVQPAVLASCERLIVVDSVPTLSKLSSLCEPAKDV